MNLRHHQKQLQAQSCKEVGVSRADVGWRDCQASPSRRFARTVLCALCVSVALLTGCSVTSGRRSTDGSLTVTNYRLLWASEAVDFSTRSEGFNARLKIGKSATDDEAVAAVVAGVVKGITQP